MIKEFLRGNLLIEIDDVNLLSEFQHLTNIKFCSGEDLDNEKVRKATDVYYKGFAYEKGICLAGIATGACLAVKSDRIPTITLSEFISHLTGKPNTFEITDSELDEILG